MKAGKTAAAPAASLLRIVACGSVDDGKSTLIGRLISETGSVTHDQLEALARASRRYGTTGGELDYALLLDGLEAEREQGITIDVAYRYFRTPMRTFIVADTPGHEEYTRNMATGASNADFGLLLVDARLSLSEQTKRHARLLSLLGIRHVLLAINKMDLVDFSEAAFAAVRNSFTHFSADFGFTSVKAIPLCARDGDNVTKPSKRLFWHAGPTILQHLQGVEVDQNSAADSRFLVQIVIRDGAELRRYAGFVASGSFARGEEVIVARSERSARISRIITFDGDIDRAEAGQAVVVELDDHMDVGRGDIIAPKDRTPHVADQFAADLVWFDEHPLLPGRTYWMRMGTQLVATTVTTLKHKLQIDGGEHIAANALQLNDIGSCNLATAVPICFDAYRDNRATGGFILIDRETAATVGAGMATFPLWRAHNLRGQSYEVDRTARAHLKAQKPCIIWFTGLSGAGKSTIANLVERKLHERGVHTYVLDGDNLRLGLNRDLGFTDAARVENIRRAGEVARLMLDAGLVVLCAFISPFHAERQMIRELVEPDEFIEVFVDTPLDVCIARDPKGLYAKARAGRALHVTGIDSPYEPPESPEIHLRTNEPAAVLAERVIEELGRIRPIAGPGTIAVGREAR